MRLIGRTLSEIYDQIACFNSGLVRLIGFVRKHFRFGIEQFQFRFGAIDRACKAKNTTNGKKFQFRFGAIDSPRNHLNTLGKMLFQFRFGAIDSGID